MTHDSYRYRLGNFSKRVSPMVGSAHPTAATVAALKLVASFLEISLNPEPFSLTHPKFGDQGLIRVIGNGGHNGHQAGDFGGRNILENAARNHQHLIPGDAKAGL